MRRIRGGSEMVTRSHVVAYAAFLLISGEANAATPCESDWECRGWAECIQGKCHDEGPGTQICAPGGEFGDGDSGCPEGCECIDETCACDGTDLVGCSTGADCTGSEDCVKGGCVGHEGGAKSASCDAPDECPEGQVCVRHRCRPEDEWCKSDSACHEMESCALECVLYEYGEGGTFEGAKCILELGKCDIDLAKIELEPECNPFCEKIGPCWQDDAQGEKGSVSKQSGSSGKEDTFTDGSDMVLECEYECSFLLSDPERQAIMSAAIECMADKEGDCDAIESACEAELEGVFGTSAGGIDANTLGGDVASEGASPKDGGTGGGGGSCSAGPPAAASAVGVMLLLVAASFIVVDRKRHGTSYCD